MGRLVPQRPPIPFPFRWVREESPGAVWTELYERFWPPYEAWFLKEGDAERPDLATARAELERHMPELVATWERLVELTGGDERVARMLTLYRPTPYVTGCSQAVWSRGEPLLVRNYDYHPSACEGTFLHSTWTGTRTLAASDCLWGVLDGMNEHGLVVSLAFGGRREVGDGFGIPLILRYVLETCRTSAAALAVLQRVPSHMTYNVTVLDASGERAVAAVAPDRSTSIVREDIATNHVRGSSWTRYHRLTKSAERERYLTELLANPRLTAKGFVQRFLRSPLYSTRFRTAFGTLYTAAYWPRTGAAAFVWPRQTVEQSIDEFTPRELVVPLGART